MNSDFAYCMGQINSITAFGTKSENCHKRMSCKRHLPIATDPYFHMVEVPPKHEYLCWVNAKECATRNYVLFLQNDEENK